MRTEKNSKIKFKRAAIKVKEAKEKIMFSNYYSLCVVCKVGFSFLSKFPLYGSMCNG